MKNASLIIAAGAAVSLASTAALGARVDRATNSNIVKTATTSNVAENATPRVGDFYAFDIPAPVESHNGLGDGANVVVTIDLAVELGFASGTPIAFNGLGWAVNITGGGTVPGIDQPLSWLSEAAINFNNSTNDSLDSISLAPGAGNDAPGGPADFANNGLKLVDAGLADILLPDGMIRLEFFEGYDDGPGVDSIWNSGTIFLQGVEGIPTPGAAAILGLGGLAMTRRRR